MLDDPTCPLGVEEYPTTLDGIIEDGDKQRIIELRKDFFDSIVDVMSTGCDARKACPGFFDSESLRGTLVLLDDSSIGLDA